MSERSRICRRAIFTLLVLGLATGPLAADEAPAKPAQVGLASYYGPGFHGLETASGRTFDQHEMVAAHRTLPFGSIVRVTNLTNGTTAVVRVVDRGPYGRNQRRGTIIDVSKAAARKLRFITRGLVRVRLDVLEQGNNRRERRAGLQ